MDWPAEARAIIDDIKPFVKRISVSEGLGSSNMIIYFDIETFESRKILVSMNSNGFCILRDDKEGSQLENNIYETINSLLDEISSGYREAFVNSLIQKMGSIHQKEPFKEDVVQNQE